MFKIYIGWDSREPEAAEVCRHSILKHSTIPVQIEFLKQDVLREQKHYWRAVDEQASTEFSLTRFLVPHLNGYSGPAVFVDCDFVFVSDVRELFQNINSKHAVHVVKHQYKPKQDTKMDGKQQHQYPRKNWSSLMLFNCAHPNCQTLTPELVNTKSPAYLHRFEWADGLAIGGLSPEWNWLVNWYHEPDDGKPKAIHYTEGGPWFENYRHCEYGWYYAEAFHSWKQSQQLVPQPRAFDNIPPELAEIFEKIIQYRIDPTGQYYKDNGLKPLIQSIEKLNNQAAVAVEADTVDEASNKLEAKGQDYDPFLKSFILGSGGQISVWDRTNKDTMPVVLRGVTKRKHMDACREAKRDFYYIDTGYFGNGRKKTFHRITKNDMQYLGDVKHRSRDRLAATGYQARKFRPGANILLAPPSQKLLMCYGIDLDKWLEETVNTIRLFTDREIIIRNKQSRSVRQSSDTMEMALERNVHCLVTFSSIAAVEAILLGKPAITLGPSAAGPITSHELSEIENPYIPTLDEVEEWAAHLAYCQFTEAEMRDGTAWRILNEDA
jgi:lipopolysaccharide biosynthesis glycosyltransferase